MVNKFWRRVGWFIRLKAEEMYPGIFAVAGIIVFAMIMVELDAKYPMFMLGLKYIMLAFLVIFTGACLFFWLKSNWEEAGRRVDGE